MESTIVINLTVPVLRSSLDSSHSQGAFTGFTTNIGRGVVQITSNGARERYFHVISCPCLFCFSDLLVQGEIKKKVNSDSMILNLLTSRVKMISNPFQIPPTFVTSVTSIGGWSFDNSNLCVIRRSQRHRFFPCLF